jgi:hypothetical protein
MQNHSQSTTERIRNTGGIEGPNDIEQLPADIKHDFIMAPDGVLRKPYAKPRNPP